MNDLDHFRACQKIMDLILSYQSRKDIWFEDNRRNDVPQPRFNQTKQGFFLESTYNQLNTLWTPWGKKMIYGLGADTTINIFEDVLGRLGTFVAQPRIISRFTGTYGPIYGIQKIDDISLSHPVLRTKLQYLSPDKAIESWNSLAGIYQQDAKKYFKKPI